MKENRSTTKTVCTRKTNTIIQSLMMFWKRPNAVLTYFLAFDRSSITKNNSLACLLIWNKANSLHWNITKNVTYSVNKSSPTLPIIPTSITRKLGFYCYSSTLKTFTCRKTFILGMKSFNCHFKNSSFIIRRSESQRKKEKVLSLGLVPRPWKI